MDLLNLPQELLSYILHFADPDTLRALCLTKKRTLHAISRNFLRRKLTLRFGPNQKSTPDVFTFDPGHLAAIRSLSIVMDGYVDLGAISFSSVLTSMINIKDIRVSGGSGNFLRLIVENTKESLVMLELDGCDAEPQDFSDIVDITIRDLRLSGCHPNVRFLLGPVVVVNLEVRGPG
ncbi:hypothetical protein EDD18DRAFT_339958 [Armillaria luteobubalina]|uniref:F-box domain-containing protein n=1 Tax=Armillaria luteobubalina TaxID=153913 RepID=A0AA39U122_9AGAR|nr:hypothetical protein EDD18DRAFT_339958 [Armillaria luteobubalina]